MTKGESLRPFLPKLVEIDDSYIDPDVYCAEWENKSRCLPAALSYAEKGWQVFPAPRGTKKSHKSAKYSNGTNWGATSDPAETRRDFAHWPNANIGIPAGIENGFFVVEADTIAGHGVDGIAALRALEAEYGPLPTTLMAESPSGSVHYYFRHPVSGIKIKCSTSEIATGVDVKGDGGMVIAPPSVRPGEGAYTWTSNLELADPPEWLLELVKEKERASAERRGEENGAANGEEIRLALRVIDPDINRSAWFSIGCALFKGVGNEAGFEAWNEWSAKGKKYREGEMAGQWQSIVAKDGYGWSVATLFHYANEADPLWREIYDEEDLELEARLRAASNSEGTRQLMARLMAQREGPRTAASDAQEGDAPGAEQDEAKPKDDEPRGEGEQPKTNSGGESKHQSNGAQGHASRIDMVRAADVVMRQKSWIWKGHLLRGGLELMTGQPGLGKSQVQCHLVACATAGSKWPDGAPGIAPVNVIMVTAEDALDSEVVPRLVAAGANLDRVYILKSIRTDKQQRQFLLAEDLIALEREIARIGEVGLVTIDPITAYMGGKMDSHKATEVRSQLSPLKDFAERCNIAVSAITHPAKNASQRAIDHFIGSQAFIAAARIGHVCIEEIEEDEDGERVPTGRTLFTNPKNNSHVKMPTLAYTIGEVVVAQDPQTRETIAAPRVIWDQGTVNISADEALAAAKPRKSRDEAQSKVQEFLKEMLSDGRPVEEKIIREYGEQRGFTIKQLRTAKEKLGIESEKTGFDGGWKWVLPF
jgi:hypothetical protein